MSRGLGMASRKKEKPLMRVTVSIDPDDHAILELLAKNNDLSASWYIRKAIRQFLETDSSAQALISEGKSE
jgi:predicted transcriptional regulator